MRNDYLVHILEVVKLVRHEEQVHVNSRAQWTFVACWIWRFEQLFTS